MAAPSLTFQGSRIRPAILLLNSILAGGRHTGLLTGLSNNKMAIYRARGFARYIVDKNGSVSAVCCADQSQSIDDTIVQ